MITSHIFIETFILKFYESLNISDDALVQNSGFHFIKFGQSGISPIEVWLALGP